MRKRTNERTIASYRQTCDVITSHMPSQARMTNLYRNHEGTSERSGGTAAVSYLSCFWMVRHTTSGLALMRSTSMH